MSTQPGTLLGVKEETSLRPNAANQELLRPGRSAENQSDFEKIQPVTHASGHTRRIIMGAAKDTGNAQSNAPASTGNRVDSRYLATIHHGNQRQIREQLQVQANTDNVDKSAKNSKQGTWSSWWDSAVSALSPACELATNVAVGASKVIKNSFQFGVGVAVKALSQPEKVLVAAWSFIETAGRLYVSASLFILSGLTNGAIWCIKNPEKVLPAVGSLLMSAGRAIGAVLGGIFSSAWEGLGAICKGDLSVLCGFICDTIGLTDLWGVLKHGTMALAAYGRGDKQAMMKHLLQFAEHAAGLALVALFALVTVGTGGVGAAVFAPVLMLRSAAQFATKQVMKQGLTACGRQFLERGAKQIAEGVIENMGKTALAKLKAECPEQMAKVAAMAKNTVGAGDLALTTQQLALDRVIKLRADSIASATGESMIKAIAGEGAETVFGKNFVRELADNVGHEQSEALLRELGLVQHVDELTRNLLGPIMDKSPRQARRHIMATLQIDRKEARKMANEIKQLMASGHSDNEIKDILSKGITDNVSEFVSGKMENNFKNTFRDGLRGELADADWSKNLNEALKDHAEKIGRNVDDLTDELVQAGWEGVDNGIKRATGGLVREGIEQAFRGLREKSKRPRSSNSSSGDPAELVFEQRSQPKAGGDDARSHSKESAANRETNHRGSGREIEKRIEQITLADGTTVRRVHIYEGERLVSQVEELESAPGSANPRRGGVNHNPERSGEGLVAKSPNSDLNRKSTLAI